MPAGGEVLVERADGIRDLAEQIGVRSTRAALGRVGVKAVNGHIENSRAQIGVNKLGGEFEPIRESIVLRVGRLVLIILADFLETFSARISVDGGSLDEV